MANLVSDHSCIVSVESISHRFMMGKQSTTALTGVDLRIRRGSLFGVIGPDGAGKTTLFRILATLIQPTEGSASVLGFDSVRDYRSIRPLLGYMPGKFSLYGDLTVEENLHFFAALFHTRVADNIHLIDSIYQQLAPFRDRRASALSGGMKQKLALCCALIHQPKLLLLDEPTTGVDAVSRKEFWDMLHRLRTDGLTIIVSTPYMDEAARCDDIALIQHGRILSTNTPAGIRGAYPNPIYAVQSSNMLELLQVLRRAPFTLHVYPFGEWHHLVVTDRSLDAHAIEYFIQERGMDAMVQPVEADIEDCFIDLMHVQV